MHHFSFGALTPSLAYLASYVGCLLGLLCAGRARVLTGAGRRGWLAIAAVSIGGTGIWVMHFIAMLGFGVSNTQIRYDMPMTAVSALVAIVAVGAGLVIVGNDARKVHRIAVAGVLTGAGVAGMHYLGMVAMVMPASLSYEPVLFGLSVLIAIVASAVALWFTLVIRGRRATFAAAALMGVAVCGMHYTGMAAMRLTPTPGVDASGGTSFGNLMLPLLLVVSCVTVVLLIFVAFSASPAELVAEAEFTTRLQRDIDARDRRRLPAPTRPRPTNEPLALPQQPTPRPYDGRQVSGNTRRY
ncbi:MAG: MHYT domain-containing protein [Actinocatenispora sp.]